MSILIDEKTPIIVQGMTGDKGSFHTKEMVEYGSNVVGGVTPGKGGQTVVDDGFLGVRIPCESFLRSTLCRIEEP